MNKYCQGLFEPKNPSKYKGTLPIVYRSAPERRLMAFADNTSNVVAWSSESIAIPYVKPTDGRVHRYFIDFTMTLKTDGKLITYLIEYKPFRQTQPPVTSKRKKHNTMITEQLNYAINRAKWDAAMQFAKKAGVIFKIITEKDLPTL